MEYKWRVEPVDAWRPAIGAKMLRVGVVLYISIYGLYYVMLRWIWGRRNGFVI